MFWIPVKLVFVPTAKRTKSARSVTLKWFYVLIIVMKVSVFAAYYVLDATASSGGSRSTVKRYKRI